MEKEIFGGNIEGNKGFILGEKVQSSKSVPDTGLTFQEGQSSETGINKERKELGEQLGDESLSGVDLAYVSLENMLKSINPYSETFVIRSDGSFDDINRADGRPMFISEAETPKQFYELAQSIQKKDPRYHFKFDLDPEGKYFKYTVTKK